MLEEFIASDYIRADGQATPFQEFLCNYYAFLAGKGISAAEWPDVGAVRMELRRLGFPIGRVGTTKIGNLLAIASPKKWVEVEHGQMRKVAA
jgi:hypothetical protein